MRGLEYYTGPVYEAELTFEVKDEDGHPVRFGSVGGGGRYDGLVGRFRGEPVPATGFSIGVSRLLAALKVLGKPDRRRRAQRGPVVVLVDRPRPDRRLPAHGRARCATAGIRAELYLGASGMKAQMKYADKRNSPCVVIQGSNERAKGEVQIKDLIEGERAAPPSPPMRNGKSARPAQFSAPESELVEQIKALLSRQG